MTTFTYDLAISAVATDAVLVTELSSELATRLSTQPVWAGHRPETLVADSSRLALVLHHRLWQHDAAMNMDAVALRKRLLDRPDSVCVMMLDETPVPAWLASARQFDFAADGLASAAVFTLDAFEACGGAVAAAPNRGTPAEALPRWSDGPAPFLSQPRAQSALRHELDALAAGLKSHVDAERALAPDAEIELHVLPSRLILRLGTVGISFSWVNSRGTTVADGRLLAIQWNGVASQTRGAAALKSASPVRERSYRAEGSAPERWLWRADEPNGRAYSTGNLVAEWLAEAAIGVVAKSGIPTNF